jgi:hypothetical protein
MKINERRSILKSLYNNIYNHSISIQKFKMFNQMNPIKLFCSNNNSDGDKNRFYAKTVRNTKPGFDNNKKVKIFNHKTLNDFQKDYEDRVSYQEENKKNNTTIDFAKKDKKDMLQKLKDMSNTNQYINIQYKWQKDMLRSKRLKENNKNNFENFVSFFNIHIYKLLIIIFINF